MCCVIREMSAPNFEVQKEEKKKDKLSVWLTIRRARYTLKFKFERESQREKSWQPLFISPHSKSVVTVMLKKKSWERKVVILNKETQVAKSEKC